MNSFLSLPVVNTLLRYGVSSGLAYALGKGWITPDTLQGVGAILGTLTAALVGAAGSTDRSAIQRVNGIPGLAAVPADEAAAKGVAPLVP